MKIFEGDEFKKDFKKLKKKYRSLEDDFRVLKMAVTAEPQGDGTKHWNCITKIEEKEIYFFKVRMMCRVVRGSDFRVIYMYNGESVELLFIEMYFKGSKELEDKNRIKDFVKKFKK
ncbi:MAG: hypothetical protein WD607_11410 [Candidatus Paceibacterota bacterium]